ncbi:hypothetical protein G6O69_02010 [Pseudenhygromyxa sp. WMMC2535]|uniref:hypothetical protein n=1 Tax=Pseudenhygromyxa sp. WMMC2535 TaxID=2712867 RepID=UPI0015545F57|nr:hypothetical protein [Pseudenhygromyxa sp. WMMC2535]NVB36589.1 hypothetical protein [Pseudenhygromyxa sp. WMMC2535]
MADDPISAWETIAAEARTLRGSPDETITRLSARSESVGSTGRELLERYEHELERMRRDHDLRIGQRTRVFVFLVIGALAMGFPLYEQAHFQSRTSAEAYPLYLSSLALMLLSFLGLVVWARESLTRTRINRLVVATVLVTLLSNIAMFAGAWAMGVAPVQIVTQLFLLMGAMVILPSLFVDRRIMVSAGGYLAGFVLAVLFPQWLFVLVAGVNLVLMLVVLVAWWPERLRGKIPERDYRA